MGVAYIILTHRGPEQVARLVDRLSTPEDRVFVHVDKRVDGAPITAALQRLERPPTMLRRIRCGWGGYGGVRAALIGIRAALAAPERFTHLVLMTGQDYPIRSRAETQAFFAEHAGQSFLSWSDGSGPRMTDAERGDNERWYWSGDTSRLLGWCVTVGGRRWHVPRLDGTGPTVPRRIPRGLTPHQGLAYWALTPEAARHCLRAMRRPGRRWYFNWVHMADENAFQMLLLASPLRAQLVNEHLRWMRWEGNHPKTVRLDDVPALRRSAKLFARKLDLAEDELVFEALDAVG